MDSARARAEKGAPRKLKRLAMSRAVWLTLTLAGGALVWEVLLSGCTSRLRLLYALRTAVGVGTWRGSPRTVKGLLAPSLRQRLCPRRAPPSSASQASIKFASSYAAKVQTLEATPGRVEHMRHAVGRPAKAWLVCVGTGARRQCSNYATCGTTGATPVAAAANVRTMARPTDTPPMLGS